MVLQEGRGAGRTGLDDPLDALSLALKTGACAICAQQGQLMRTYTDTRNWEDFRAYYGLQEQDVKLAVIPE